MSSAPGARPPARRKKRPLMILRSRWLPCASLLTILASTGAWTVAMKVLGRKRKCEYAAGGDRRVEAQAAATEVRVRSGGRQRCGCGVAMGVAEV
jgi:hypothetical protein